MLKPSSTRPRRAAIVRNVASTRGMRSSITTDSMGTVPSLESHHMLAPMPFGNTTMTGGIRPCAVAFRNQPFTEAMPAVGLPEPCSQ